MRFIKIILTVLLLLTPVYSYAKPTYEQIVILGDSYSDNGNTYRASQNTYPQKLNYYQGRFSDGLVWSEYLAKFFGIDPNDLNYFRNYAYGQAQIVGVVDLKTHRLKKQWRFTVPDLAKQVDEYLQEGSDKINNTLFVIFIGANDILNIENLPNINKNDFVEKMVGTQLNQVRRLEKLGAKNLLIVTARDLSSSPLAHQQAENYFKSHQDYSVDEYLRELTNLVKLYNLRLATTFADDKKIVIYNSYNFDSDLINKTKSGGYKYNFDGKEYVMNEASKECYINKGNYADSVGPSCTNSQNYFYIDRIHPTTYAHYLMAKDVYEKAF